MGMMPQATGMGFGPMPGGMGNMGNMGMMPQQTGMGYPSYLNSQMTGFNPQQRQGYGYGQGQYR